MSEELVSSATAVADFRLQGAVPEVPRNIAPQKLVCTKTSASEARILCTLKSLKAHGIKLLIELRKDRK